MISRDHGLSTTLLVIRGIRHTTFLSLQALTIARHSNTYHYNEEVFG
jgi:hypothetical protein